MRVDASSVRVRLEEEEWVGELAAPTDQPQWVGSVAVRQPIRIETPTETPVPSEPPAKPWWKKLFGR